MKKLKKILCVVFSGLFLMSTLLFGAACKGFIRISLTEEEANKINFERTYGEILDKGDLISVTDKINMQGEKTETEVWIYLYIPPFTGSTPPTDKDLTAEDAQDFLQQHRNAVKEHNTRACKEVLEEINFERYFKDYEMSLYTPIVWLKFDRPLTVFDVVKIYEIAKEKLVAGVNFSNINSWVAVT